MDSTNRTPKPAVKKDKKTAAKPAVKKNEKTPPKPEDKMEVGLAD